MKVYHGSYTCIETVDFSKCKPRKDFGRGFYVTKIRRHAENWANVIGENNNTEGVVTEFEYTEDSFTENICKIKHFSGYTEEWLDFIVMNRDKKSPEPAHDYDIVEGPVANDKIQNTLRFYLRGTISKAKFLEMLTFHEETHQLCFCTLNSLQTLERIDDTPSMEVIAISAPLLEALMLEKNIDEKMAASMLYTSNTFAELSEKTTGLYKKTWREIYEMLKREL
ncbi:MAG: DUF3990 domain-containing protein [Prevotellaceae bacterium]|jgi:hypothetical protein|nr:DUF3990 domain-containing protein [Prevotellaceae bacterium]